MTIEDTKKIIRRIKDNLDLIVLKGFPTSIYSDLSDEYSILDDYIFENNKINLSRIEFNSLLIKILSNTSIGIITYESLLNLNTNLRDLNVLNKRIVVLTNNLKLRIENPTTISIPDFDSAEFQLDDSNGLYCNYYSFCSHYNSKEFVEYIEVIDDNDRGVKYVNLINPVELTTVLDKTVTSNIKRLSANDGTLEGLLTSIFEGNHILDNEYTIEPIELESKNDRSRFEVLLGACNMLRHKITLISSQNDIKLSPRKELFELLNNVWGYRDFRNLRIYKDLSRGREVIEISQGEIIETVVSEAEKALFNDKAVDMCNVLLTAPTGAGKSLLFQMAAIYLAKKHRSLTIVISPLVALMNDQVNGLTDKYENVAALNSDKSPQDKSEILEKIQNGEINLLYLAPELLLSYTISTFIGERRIGLLVVDEAHTVTTWGRDFRVDYWFLGEYIRKAKRNLGYNFPLFALTATAVWDPSGRNDMVFETVRSLHMAPCLKYIGDVRRENIVFDIGRFKGFSNYNISRNQMTADRITEFISTNKKTIVYFPYKRTIHEIINDCLPQSIERKIAEYHADLDSKVKRSNANDFKSGLRPVMCATKAFGMGIDVSDIEMVYHHAPTGALSDYVQEIGRLARESSITGIAKIDFSEKDLKFIKALHGLSAIRPYQLFSVLRKLMQLYNMKAEKRNMLISASDFEFIFPGKKVDYDQKVKSCLLLLENDLLNKYRFHSIIVRPKNLFSKAYLRIKNEEKLPPSFMKYMRKIDTEKNVYLMHIDTLWEKEFPRLTFPDFKRRLTTGEIMDKESGTFVCCLEISLEKEIIETRNKLLVFFSWAEKVLSEMITTHKQKKIDEMKEDLIKLENNILTVESYVESFILIYCTNKSIVNNQAYAQVKNSTNSIQCLQSGFEVVREKYITTFDNTIKSKQSRKFVKSTSNEVRLGELLDSLNIGSFSCLSGDRPAIFVRINNPNRLKDIIRSGNYSNDILNNIHERFISSQNIYKYFFSMEMTNQERWDFIEDYFLGKTEEELLKK